MGEVELYLLSLERRQARKWIVDMELVSGDVVDADAVWSKSLVKKAALFFFSLV